MVIYILMLFAMLALSVQDIKRKEISAKLLIIGMIISVIGALIGVLIDNMSLYDIALSLLPGALLLLLS